MTDPAVPPPLPPMASLPSRGAAPSPARVLHKLFLTVFLRGRSSRGLNKDRAPTTVGRKLAVALTFYALFGTLSLFFAGKPVFGLALYLHAMTFVFVGMFVANSSGEVLFNKDEPDILLHRPIKARTLLWAKISVMVQVSLWLACAFNLAGFCAGVAAPDSGWLFPPAHACSTVFETLFCAGCVVLVYQLCLQWFGREKLDALMTTSQVIVAIVAFVGGQLMPQLFGSFSGKLNLTTGTWWIALVPPAWFAAFDDAVAGSRASASWILAGIGLVATTVVLWLSFGKLAAAYELGLQTLSETVAPRPERGPRGRRLARIASWPPICWGLREPVSRASFLLVGAYLTRDRDVKLRVYPALAPMLVLPIIFLLRDFSRRGGDIVSGFNIAFCGVYLGLIPMLGLNLLQYSQQWQAADLFRAVPVTGPAQLHRGARMAVLTFLALPIVLIFGLIAWFSARDSARLLLLLPGIITLPVYALLPAFVSKGVPLSQPTEEAKSAGRGLAMIVATVVSFILAAMVNYAWADGWFWWFLLIEAVVMGGLYTLLSAALNKLRWQPDE